MITNTNNKHVNELSQALVDDTWKALEQASLGGRLKLLTSPSFLPLNFSHLNEF